MNPEAFPSPSRRTFIKRSACSAVAASFAYSSTSILTSCSTTGVTGSIQTPLGSLTFTWSGGSSQNGMTVQEMLGGALITNTNSDPVTITGIPGGPITIPPGGSHFVAEQ